MVIFATAVSLFLIQRKWEKKIKRIGKIINNNCGCSLLVKMVKRLAEKLCAKNEICAAIGLQAAMADWKLAADDLMFAPLFESYIEKPDLCVFF